jgi:DNA-binding transcriptional ArsR family regulator
MWGIIWIIGYTVTAAIQEMSIVWMPLIVIGVVGSILLARRDPSGRTQEFGWRYGASFAVIGIFNTALVAVMSPLDYNQMSALIPLAVGVYYAFIGIWTKAWRMMPLGLALIGLTALGYFMMPAILPLLDGGCRRRRIDRGWSVDAERLIMTDQPDPMIHQPVRLKIMSALKALPERDLLEFVRLKALSGATEGNLGAHISSLEQAGYIEVQKDFPSQPATHPRESLRAQGGGPSRIMSPFSAASSARPEHRPPRKKR